MDITYFIAPYEGSKTTRLVKPTKAKWKHQSLPSLCYKQRYIYTGLIWSALRSSGCLKLLFWYSWMCYFLLSSETIFLCPLFFHCLQDKMCVQLFITLPFCIGSLWLSNVCGWSKWVAVSLNFEITLYNICRDAHSWICLKVTLKVRIHF